MQQHINQPDFGAGQKKLGIYLAGLIGCSLLTLLAFFVVISNQFSKPIIFIIIYSAACLQLIIQLICFLRLDTETEQGKTNVLSFVFTGVILMCIVIGSLWIMSNLNYNMLH